MSSPLLIARTLDKQLHLLPAMANRHGLIAGATGTGKTVSLRRMAEAFSEQGIPVFLVDVKGDLSGLVNAGANSGKVAERMQQFGLPENYLQGFPVRFWDVFGENVALILRRRCSPVFDVATPIIDSIPQSVPSPSGEG